MRRLLIAVLMLAATPAWGAWLRYAQSDATVDYYNPASVKRSGNRSVVTAILDYRKRRPSGALSYRIRYEYACEAKRYRILSLSCRSGRMAKGTSTCSYRGRPTAWQDTRPGTVSGKLLKTVCS
jgi:hypothetical protein